MRLLVLTPEAFGGFGGIAQYDRDLLEALTLHPRVTEVVAFPRLMPHPPGELPAKLTYRTEAVGGKGRYLAALARYVLKDARFDLIICAHPNLLPIAFALRARIHAPILLVIYGIDAWTPTPSRLANRLAPRVDWVAAISQVTLDKFRAWAPVPPERCVLWPNAIDASRYGPGPKDPALEARYGLAGKRVLMTFGRMAASERYKGFDEVMAILPQLPPDICHLAVGDGDDRPRLEARARELGVAERVVFPGRIAEAEKAAHYRLADAYVMPSYGEGFGFVFLEALACGVPVVASRVDGSREAVRDGLLGELVEPTDPQAIRAAVEATLAKPREVPAGLEYFSYERFRERVHAFLDKAVPS